MNNNKLYTNMWEIIINFIEETGYIANLSEYYQEVLNRLAKYIPYDAAHIIIHVNPNENPHENIHENIHENSHENLPHGNLKKSFTADDFITANIKREAVEAYIDYYQHIDPIKSEKYDSYPALKSSQFLDYREWQRTEYFNDFLQKYDFYYLCGKDIHYQNSILVTLTFIRNRDHQDFCTADKLLLNRLSPFIANHIHLLSKLTKPRQELLFSGYPDCLTPREKEVAKLVKSGLTNKEISDDLYISVNTVKKHLQQIYGKCGVSGKNNLIIKLLSEDD